jgi:hypothetical protein
LAAQIGTGHPGFQRLHARIGLGFCHRTLPMTSAAFSAVIGPGRWLAKIVWLPY